MHSLKHDEIDYTAYVGQNRSLYEPILNQMNEMIEKISTFDSEISLNQNMGENSSSVEDFLPNQHNLTFFLRCLQRLRNTIFTTNKLLLSVRIGSSLPETNHIATLSFTDKVSVDMTFTKLYTIHEEPEPSTNFNTVYEDQSQPQELVGARSGPEPLVETQSQPLLMVRTIKPELTCTVKSFTACRFKLTILFTATEHMSKYSDEKEFITLHFLPEERNWKTRKRKQIATFFTIPSTIKWS